MPWHGRLPLVCPICGAVQPMVGPGLYGKAIEQHFRREHADEIGRCRPSYSAVEPWREFVAIGGKLPIDVRSITVVFLDWPIETALLAVHRFEIEWAKDGRAVPVNEGSKA